MKKEVALKYYINLYLGDEADETTLAQLLYDLRTITYFDFDKVVADLNLDISNLKDNQVGLYDILYEYFGLIGEVELKRPREDGSRWTKEAYKSYEKLTNLLYGIGDLIESLDQHSVIDDLDRIEYENC